MKELSIEEKAYDGNYKAYTELINRLEDVKDAIKKQNYGIAIDVLCKPYPEFQVTTHSELKESEDEKIRKAFREHLTTFRDNYGRTEWYGGIKIDDAIDWLERQGEQKPVKFKPLFKFGDVIKPKDPALGEPRIIKGIYPKFGYDTNNGILDFEFEDNWELVEQNPADKVEPKFHEGDWTVSNLDKKARQISEVHFDEYNSYYVVEGKSVNLEEYDRLHHLWTIQDAKDGDVLEFGDHGRLVVGIVSYVNKTTGKVDVNCLLENNNFKMGNYYNLDTIKPHPATKEQRDTLMKAMADAGYTFDFERKELKKIENEIEIPFGAKYSELQEATYYIPKGFHAEIEGDKVVIKKGEKPIAWSEDDEKLIHCLEYTVKHFYEDEDTIKWCCDWLKSLKDKVQPKQEWSEEEIENCAREAEDNNCIILAKHIRQLKSLRPQNTWKPSDEQMERLKETINSLPHQEVLYSLYQDLKKLKEE